MTDEEIDAIFEAMPGGVQGFCRDYGYRQFARAVLDAAGIEPGEGWRELVEQLIACHEDRSCPAVDWARAMLAGTMPAR